MQIQLLKLRLQSGVALQTDQLEKLGNRNHDRLLREQSTLRWLYPDVFFLLADTFAKYSEQDFSEIELRDSASATDTKFAPLLACYGGRKHYGNRVFDFCNTFEQFDVRDVDDWKEAGSFHVPLFRNEIRNARTLYACHRFDIDSAIAACRFATQHPDIMLSKCESHPSTALHSYLRLTLMAPNRYELLLPVTRIMQQAQPHSARLITNMFVRYLPCDSLRRLVQSPLHHDAKFKVALSELQLLQPQLAELLTFHFHELNRFSAQRPLDVDPYERAQTPNTRTAFHTQNPNTFSKPLRTNPYNTFSKPLTTNP